MSPLVLKFGGSSLATDADLARVRDIVLARREPVVVVVSARGDATDRLVAALAAAEGGDLDRAREEAAAVPGALPVHRRLREELDALLAEAALRGRADAALRDAVLAHGERMSAHDLSAVLAAAGRLALPVDARGLVQTDARHGAARVDLARTRARIQAAWPGWRGRVPVVTGFIGASPTGATTTLGRDGSDLSATVLGRCLDARAVEIWTDVPGILSADPAEVLEARLLPALSPDAAGALAAFGARVLHPRTLAPLRDAGIPLRVRGVREPTAAGTTIHRDGAVAAVTSLDGCAVVRLPEASIPRLRAVLADPRILQPAAGPPVGVVSPQDRAAVLDAVPGAHALPGARAVVSVVGAVPEDDLPAHLDRAGIAAQDLGWCRDGPARAFAVHPRDRLAAVRALHGALHPAPRVRSVFLLGVGTVGGALLQTLGTCAGTLARDHGLHCRLVGVATSTCRAFAPGGLDPGRWRSAARPGAVDEALLDRLAALPEPVLVDCTAADGPQALYARALARGIHVVAANKKAFTAPQAERDRLSALARRHGRELRYETTVGAALPVVATLQDIVRTGDRVVRVEGALSGSLGFVCDRLNAGVPLEEAVRAAVARGYTEPRPQEDLSGTDAARKALILARELGLRLELDEVRVTPLVPGPLLDEPDPEAFLARLGEGGAQLEAQVSAARATGRRLRYLAVVDPTASPPLRVGPELVGPAHPAFHLRGSQALVAFTTRRYPEQPLVVQGAGAGGEVTASGVLAEVLRIGEGARAAS